MRIMQKDLHISGKFPEMEILDRIKVSYYGILQNKLVGIYIHGSIAFGCFNWNKSDIDFLVIVNQELSLREKMLLIGTLLDLDVSCPPKGLEMSVVHEKYCNPFLYPTPFELHFSNKHMENCKRDLEQYCLHMNGTDKDLAAHFTVTRNVGITLYGKDTLEVFAPVPKDAYLDSLRYDIEDAASEIEKNPVYIILNLCRVLAYIREGVILSKKQGGEWARKKLPKSYQGIIDGAIEAYCGNEDFCPDKDTARDFAIYMLGQIFGEESFRE